MKPSVSDLISAAVALALAGPVLAAESEYGAQSAESQAVQPLGGTQTQTGQQAAGTRRGIFAR